MNKTLLKLAGLVSLLAIFEALTVLYWFIRCVQTSSDTNFSNFYCGAFEWGIIFFLFGPPALVLLSISFFTLLFSKWYKGNVSNVVIVITTIVSIIIFITPFILYLSFKEGPKTYRGDQKLTEQNIIRQEQEKAKEKEQECLKYKFYMSQWKNGDPMPTFDPKDCI